MKILLLALSVFLLSCKGEIKEGQSDIGAINNHRTDEFITVNFDEFEDYVDEHNSKILVVNFWATWCKPCIKELPAFEKLKATSKADDVSVILVSLDFPSQLDKLKTFISKKGLKSEILLLDDSNENEWIPKVNQSWSGAIPATLIISDEYRAFYERSFTYEELKETVEVITKA